MESRIAHAAGRLNAWGLSGMAAALLAEGAGPLAFVGAQALYMAGPLLAPFAPEDDLLALAQLLEDPAAVRALAEQFDETPSG